MTNNPDDNPEGSESEAMNWPIFCGALIAVSIIVGMIVLVREGNVPTSTPSSTIRSASSVSGSTPKRHSQQPIVHSNPDKEMLRKAQSAENEARIVLEQQRRENQSLREKMNQSTSISSVQMEKMRSEMSQLEQELKEKELALIEKEKLLQDAEEKSSSTVVQNITYNIHDSAITSDEFGNIIGKKDD